MQDTLVRVTMPDGSVWDIPARPIAEDRARYYAKKDIDAGCATDFDAVFAKEVAYALEEDDGCEIVDWMRNNMDWPFDGAAMITPPTPVDYASAWNDSTTRVVR